MNCCSARGVLVAVIMCLATVIALCQGIKETLSNVSQVTDDTTMSFRELTLDDGIILTRTDTSAQANILNGSFCQRAYACNSVSMLDAESVIRRCSCHDYCAIFGDCCSDKMATLHPSEPAHVPRKSFTCAPKKFFRYSVYTITSCPASYRNRAIAENCSNFTDYNAYSIDNRWTPVTDIVTGATFRNVYCAICWGKTRQHVASWLWRFTCSEEPYESEQLQVESDNSSTVPGDNKALDNELTAASYVRSSCSLTFDPPKLNASLQFCIEEAIADCGLTSNTDAAFDDALISACERGPARHVYDEFGSLYWNAACATCRHWPNQPILSCQSTVVAAKGSKPSLSLSIILTPDSGNCAAAAGSLSSSDGWTPEALCRGLRGCPNGSRAPGCPTDPEAQSRAVAGSGRHISVSSASVPIKNCTFSDSLLAADMAKKVQSAFWHNTSAVDGSVALVVVLNDNETLCFRCALERYYNFTVANESLVVVTARAGSPLEYIAYPMYTVEGTVATVCRALQSHGESASSGDGGCAAVPAFVSALLLCLSEAGLVIFFAAFARAPSLRRFPGEMVLNCSVAFFLAFFFFLVRPLVGSLPVACTTLAVLIHYFLLAAFAWTALYSTEIARALRFRVSEGVTKRRRTTYYIVAWGTPLVCVVIGLGADASALDFRPLYGPPQCFIGSRLGNLTLFMAPLCIFLTVDIIVYIYIIAKLMVIARQTKSVRSSHHEKLRLSVKLVFSMGILWLSAVLASFTQSASLYCVFSLLNALQGVFVFAVFVCKRDVLVMFRRKSKSSKTKPALASSWTRSTTSAVLL